ncbi:MAG TPA: hypothetical protein VIL85_11875 [Thermomicrobiales bacterium]|jgi:hypothetical protein
MADEQIDAGPLVQALMRHINARQAHRTGQHTDDERRRVEDTTEEVAAALVAIIDARISAKLAAITGDV